MIDDERMLNYFARIMEGTHGSNTLNAEIITYKNGSSISLNQIKEEYIKYKKLDEEIDQYVEDSSLDVKNDRDNIIQHFKDTVDKDLFNSWYGFLKDFTVYMITKIDKMNENYVVNNYESKIQEKNQSIEIEDDELEL